MLSKILYTVGIFAMIALFSGPIAAESVSNKYYSGGDGSSFNTAVKFPNAKSSLEGVPLEGKWISQHYSSYRKVRQSAVSHKGKMYDVIVIKSKSGETKNIYFDMSNWFGFSGLK